MLALFSLRLASEKPMDEEVQCPHLFVRGATGSSVSSCRRPAGHGRGGVAIAPVCDRYPRNWLEKEHLTAVGILTATIVPAIRHPLTTVGMWLDPRVKICRNPPSNGWCSVPRFS